LGFFGLSSEQIPINIFINHSAPKNTPKQD
jgi:hypothetical protein